jgi:hypothetical protein
MSKIELPRKMQENDSSEEDYMEFFETGLYIKGFILKYIIDRFKVGNQKYEQAPCEDRREEKTTIPL